MNKLFVDCDGVLADFDAGYEKASGIKRNRGHNDDVDWKIIRKNKDFFLNLEPMEDMQELWDYVAPYNPTILTGLPMGVDEAPHNKVQWVRKHLGFNVDVICCMSRDKWIYSRPGDIIIDDWIRYQDKWIDAGGIWITHTSAKDTIRQLKGMQYGVV